MRTRHFLLLLFGALLIAFPGSPTLGQEKFGADTLAIIGDPQGQPLTGAQLDRVTEDLTDRMRCPVCQGLSIADSGTMIALAMKEEVRQFLAAGYTEEQILLYFEASYGEFIRLEPKPTGFNLFVWIAPIVALLIGLVVVVLRLRSGPKPAPVPAEKKSTPQADELEAYREQVRREVTS